MGVGGNSMKITIEFNSVEEYLEFKEKTAQEEQVQEQSININLDRNKIFKHLANYGKDEVFLL